MSLAQKLQEVGLSEKESLVYKALLELGQSTASQLAFKSGVNRVTTYVILDKLINFGLASSLIKKKKVYFNLENPHYLIDYLQRQKKKLESKIKKAKEIIPELSLFEKLTSERSKVSFYEGLDGIKMIQADFAKSKASEYYSIFNLAFAYRESPPYYENFLQVVKKNKMKSKSIVIFESNQTIPNMPFSGNGEKRCLPSNKFPFKSDITIFKNKVIIISRQYALTGMLLENKELADSLKVLFELAWKGAKEYTVVGQNKN